jgi:NRPS condensation-like uncharacterized protein
VLQYTLPAAPVVDERDSSRVFEHTLTKAETTKIVQYAKANGFTVNELGVYAL